MKKTLFILSILVYGIANAQIKNLLEFTGTNGSNPFGGLTLSGNRLFGMTYSGGANGNGIIFSIKTDGSGFKDLLDFNNTNGANPCFGSLCISRNSIYGITEGGGLDYDGVIFKYENLITGIPQIANLDTQISVFPNPSTGKITIDLNGTSDLQNTFVSIYDIQGKIIFQQPLTQDKSEINMNQFSTGIYVVKIFDDNTAFSVRKIVVK